MEVNQYYNRVYIHILVIIPIRKHRWMRFKILQPNWFNITVDANHNLTSYGLLLWANQYFRIFWWMYFYIQEPPKARFVLNCLDINVFTCVCVGFQNETYSNETNNIKKAFDFYNLQFDHLMWSKCHIFVCLYPNTKCHFRGVKPQKTFWNCLDWLLL